jgi:hypothetical protein
MNEPRTPPDSESPQRLLLRRRAKRGLIASYIHQLSERHNGGHSRTHRLPEDRTEQSQGE